VGRVPGRVDLGLEREIDMASKHSDLNITTLHRNTLFDAREWGDALEGPWEGRLTRSLTHSLTHSLACLLTFLLTDSILKHILKIIAPPVPNSDRFVLFGGPKTAFRLRHSSKIDHFGDP
jgi:hypothetical protein